MSNGRIIWLDAYRKFDSSIARTGQDLVGLDWAGLEIALPDHGLALAVSYL